MQDLQTFFWDIEDIRKRLTKMMLSAFVEVGKAKEKYDTDMRTAAYIVAIERVANALKQRGYYPM